MKTQVVYVLIGSERTLFLEEMWVSLYSLRHFHPEAKVTVLADEPTATRISERDALKSLISEVKIVPVPNDYDDRLRSRYIKTNVRNLIDGDYFYIDTDTVICAPLDDIDNIEVENIGMVPEMHGPFKEHMTYSMICRDVKRIFNIDISDSRYWYNAGIMFVRDNETTREFFNKWQENWKYSAFEKNVTSDMRAMICTDKSMGYMCDSIPDVFNCQLAMSLKYFHEAKILHFWHMRSDFTPEQEYSPFTSKDIYKQIKKDNGISEKTAIIILNAKSSFAPMSMVVGKSDIDFLFSSFHTILWRKYKESASFHWFVDKLVVLVRKYNGFKKRIVK